MATKIVDNGPFDQRITSIPFMSKAPGWQGNKLTRGWIIQEKPVSGIRYRCNFLYNPSVVSISHSVNPNVVANQDAVNPYDVTAGQFLMPLQQTLSFSLLFDRTYELWDSSKLSGDAAAWVPTYGVAWDVLTLYKITGISTPIKISGSGTDQTGESAENFTKGLFENAAVGPMLYVPVYAVFGNALDYYGVIQELDVQYTHWTQYMVPSRCQVDISMQLLPKNTSKGNAFPDPSGGTRIPGLGGANGNSGVGGNADFNNPNNGKAGR